MRNSIQFGVLTIFCSLLFYSRHGKTILDSKEVFSKVINQYKDIGIDEFIIYFPFFNSREIENIKLIVNEAIPDLR
ncbi:MAG: hypothetical protein ACFFE4_12160 [Candidatus Thorarchaeota archaeon]